MKKKMPDKGIENKSHFASEWQKGLFAAYEAFLHHKVSH